MGVTTVTNEFKSAAVPAQRMFKAMVQEISTIYPIVFPHIFKSFQVIHGDGGAGTITQSSFLNENQELKTMKSLVEVMDPANCYAKYKIMEADQDQLGEGVESMVNEVKIEGDGEGCICKATAYWHHATVDQLPNKDKVVKSFIEQGSAFYKAMEEYLLANPSVCA